MKTFIFTTSLVVFVAASSFGQGTVFFKTTQSADPVLTSTDGTTASLALLPTTGLDGSFGTVSYAVLTAPSTTPLLHGPSFEGTPSGWTVTLVGPVTYSQPGTVTSIMLTLPASSGAPGVSVDMEIVAFTGSYASPTQFASSGDTFPAVTTVGAYSWVQPTGNPSGIPNNLPATIVTGTAGFGSLILNQDGPGSPEPSTIAIGGLGAALLLYFRRRK